MLAKQSGAVRDRYTRLLSVTLVCRVGWEEKRTKQTSTRGIEKAWKSRSRRQRAPLAARSCVVTLYDADWVRLR